MQYKDNPHLKWQGFSLLSLSKMPLSKMPSHLLHEIAFEWDTSFPSPEMKPASTNPLPSTRGSARTAGGGGEKAPPFPARGSAALTAIQPHVMPHSANTRKRPPSPPAHALVYTLSKPPALPAGTTALRLRTLHVRCLRAFLTFPQFIGDVFTLAKRPKSFHLDSRMMHKHICCILAGNESVTLLVVKPFHLPTQPLTHFQLWHAPDSFLLRVKRRTGQTACSMGVSIPRLPH